MTEDPWHALRAWGADARPGAQLGGTVNDVKMVEIDGSSYVARLSGRSEADLDWEIELLKAVDSAGLRVPRLLRTQDGRCRNGSMVVMEYIAGTAPSTERDWGRVAAYLADLHALTRRWPQRPGWRSCAELRTYERTQSVDLTLLPPDVLAACREAWAELGDSQSVIHGDANPTNVLFHNDGVVLLDWDEARVDSPLLDAAYLPVSVSGLSFSEHHTGRKAFLAWEVALFWTRAPQHAARRLEQLIEMRACP